MSLMKRYLAFLTIALALFACKKTQPTGEKYLPGPVLATSTGTIQFDANGGEAYLTVSGAKTLTAKSDRDWVLVTVDGAEVVFNAGFNNSFESRYASVLISDGTASRAVEVVQFGYSSKYVWEEEYRFTNQGGTLSLLYEDTDNFIRVKVEEAWISAIPAEGVFSITVEKNSGVAREGAITWQCGDDVRTITIKQAAGTSGGGDNPGGGDQPADVTYASWIGSWNSSAGALVISEASEEQGMYIMSFAQFGQQNVPAFFNAETGALEFYAYSLGTDGNWEYWFCAVDSENYIETGGPNDDIMLASATLNAAKTGFTIEGNEYEAVYGGTPYDEVIVQLLVAGYLSVAEGEQEPGWYTFNGMSPVDLPAAYTKAGTSSVKNVPLVLSSENYYSSVKNIQKRQ